jgi:chromosome partitioning protein
MILAEYLTFHFGKRVLLIDMDAQANLSYIMVPYHRIQEQEQNHRTIYHFFQSTLLGQPRSFSDFVARPPLMVSNINRQFDSALHRSRETLDMVISTPSVAQLEEDLLKLWEGNKPIPTNLRFVLKEGLGQVQDQYDVVLIDCPPGLSLFTSTALIASDLFVSPIIPEPLSLEGVRLVQDRARELGREYKVKVEFIGIILNIVKYYRRQHQITAQEVYGARNSELRPLLAWLPDNERLRGLGEFEIDEERIRDGWGGGVEKKFHSVYTKYSITWLLNNPTAGALSQMREVEGDRYRLHERIERVVEEFGNRIGILQ